VLAQQAQGLEQQVVEVEQALTAQRIVVALPHVGHQVGVAVGDAAQVGGRHQLVLGQADARLDEAGVQPLLGDAQLAHGRLDRRLLVGGVADREALGEAEQLGVLAQAAHAEGVEGAHRDAVGLGCADQLAEALLHLAGGLVGEGHRQDRLRLDEAGQHVGDPVGDHPRLAGPRAGQDEEGALQGLGGVPLLGVQSREELVGRRRHGGPGRIADGPVRIPPSR
jgi:hypothetical protein